MRKSTIRVGILLIVMLALAAWQPNNNEAPYTGSYSVSYPTSGEVRSNATSIKWTSTAISNMDGDVNAEYLDQTADCTTDSPEGDKLYPLYVTTNIPDRGVYSYNDCGNSAGRPSVNEEVELHINEDSLSAGTSYYYNITWGCNGAPLSGDVNISYETGLAHDWLDKISYSCSSARSSSTNQVQLSEISSSSEMVTTQHSASFSPEAQRTTNYLEEVVQEIEREHFAYEVVRTEAGDVRVRADVEFEDPYAFEAYRQYNRNLATQLVTHDRPMQVVLTFSSPLGTEEAQQLVEGAGVKVLVYGAFGTTQDGEIIATYVWPRTDKIEFLPAIEGVAQAGIMTITGIVDSSQIRVLESNSRVVLADVVGNQIQQEVVSSLDETVELEQVGMPNPAWQIFADDTWHSSRR